MKSLTVKQRRFVDAYIETGNAAEAARRAGYKSRNADVMGRENLRKPTVRKVLEARLKELEDAQIADAKEVMQFLTASMRGETQEEVVVVEGDGKGYSSARIIKKQLSAHDRLDAAKQLAKRFGLDSAAIDNVDEGPVILEGGDDVRD
jgi:phage terminase small subunit|nr:MAG TPA: Terminase small subunit [Caudoviricetes sp.]